jgi:predicted transcriptional regulator
MRQQKAEARPQVQVRLPQPMMDRLDAEAERRRVSKTYLVEQMVGEQLPKWEKQKIASVG